MPRQHEREGFEAAVRCAQEVVGDLLEAGGQDICGHQTRTVWTVPQIPISRCARAEEEGGR